MKRRSVRLLASAHIITSRGPATMSVYDAGMEITAVRFVGHRLGPTLVRIHSQCVTSELFGSLHCDCREQLDLAMDRIAEAGGVLLYEPTEGRGIGLVAKLRAYELQASGMDTFAANRHLGLPEDSRDFAASASVLRHLNLERFELLTNNPRKLEAVQSAGLAATVRPLFGPLRPENAHYVACKTAHAGHAEHPSLSRSAS
jgi:GTP cyclohydrolase II